MAKRKKRKIWLKVEALTELGCTVRPVCAADVWCRPQTNELAFLKFLSGEPQHGYVVTVPNVLGQEIILGKINGRIVRSKKRYGMLLLQVVEAMDSPKYGVKSFIRESTDFESGEKKQSKIINIRNFRKTSGKW